MFIVVGVIKLILAVLRKIDQVFTNVFTLFMIYLGELLLCLLL